MVNKNLKKIAMLALSLAVVTGSTAFALTSTDTAGEKNPTKITKKGKLKEHGNKEHLNQKQGKKVKGAEKGASKKEHFGKQGLFKELGITKEDILSAKKSGKTIFDLAKEKKGLTPDEVRNLMIQKQTENINKKVTDGKLTKEKADLRIEKLKEKISKWDGKIPEHKKDKANHKEQKPVEKDSTKTQ